MSHQNIRKIQLDSLPQEILQEIFQYIRTPSSFGKVNKRFHRVSCSLEAQCKYALNRYGMSCALYGMCRDQYKILNPPLTKKIIDHGESFGMHPLPRCSMQLIYDHWTKQPEPRKKVAIETFTLLLNYASSCYGENVNLHASDNRIFRDNVIKLNSTEACNLIAKSLVEQYHYIPQRAFKPTWDTLSEESFQAVHKILHRDVQLFERILKNGLIYERSVDAESLMIEILLASNLNHQQAARILLAVGHWPLNTSVIDKMFASHMFRESCKGKGESQVLERLYLFGNRLPPFERIPQYTRMTPPNDVTSLVHFVFANNRNTNLYFKEIDRYFKLTDQVLSAWQEKRLPEHELYTYYINFLVEQRGLDHPNIKKFVDYELEFSSWQAFSPSFGETNAKIITRLFEAGYTKITIEQVEKLKFSDDDRFLTTFMSEGLPALIRKCPVESNDQQTQVGWYNFLTSLHETESIFWNRYSNQSEIKRLTLANLSKTGSLRSSNFPFIHCLAKLVKRMKLNADNSVEFLPEKMKTA